MSVTRNWLAAASAPAVDAPRLGGIDHIEFWVGNARASAAFFASCYGFGITAYAGPETGVTDRVSYVLTQGDIRFVVTAGIVPSSPIVAHVELGNLEHWVDFYARVFGFEQMIHFDDEAISTEYSALMSTVVWDGSKVVLPINEPAEGRRKSQIEEYLDWYGGPGVQHIALQTEDIVATVRALRDRGVRFLRVPPEYYDDAKVRMAGIDLPWEALAELGILADRDHEGYLLQVFTETMGDRPTLFFE